MPARSRCPLFLLLILAAAAPAFAQTFVFHLSGDQEAPPVASVATGGCMATLNQPAQQTTVTCVHDVSGPTVMHIHRGAPGVNGPVVFDLGDPTSPVTATWSGMTPADIADMLAGNFYINIHTSGRPGGEIRGQFLPRTVDMVAFTANGAQSVPPNASPATASCTADLDNSATSLALQCTHDFPSPQQAHVHEAPAGQNGPVVFTFPSPNSPLSANMPMTPQLVADFAAKFLYLEIHGAPGSDESTPAAQIRGQIGTPPAPPTTGTIEIVKTTQPAGGTGFSFTDNVPGSPGTFGLNDGQTRTFSAVPAGTYTISESDPAVTPGGYTLGDLSCNDADSSGDTAARTATVRLAAGETVRCTFRNIRTAATDTLFVFHLSGDQEAPPVATAERGGCMARFNSAASELTLICTHDVASPTVMHIHRGAPGVNGPVVFDLGSPVSPVSATWSGMTPADVADLMSGNLYINIHTAGRPAGAIRGQILPRTVDMVNFTLDSGQVVPPGTSTATGSCTADLDNAATSLAVQCTHNLPSPDEAHVHDAPFGANGPVVFTFPSAVSPFSANVPVTPRLVADFAAYFLYVEVHGSAGGEAPDAIRGQIGSQAAPPATGTIRVVKSTVPAGGSGFGFTDNVPGSTGSFTLGDGGVRTFTNVAAGTYTITETNPAGGGYTLTDVHCDDADSSGNTFARTASVHVQAGETVTCTFRNLQNQPASTLFVFHLSGDQEVPPVATAATGGCFAQFNAAASQLSIVCTHNVSSPVQIHIHRGGPGVNGPILFDLGDPVSPVEAVWTGMTPADVADLLAGNLYLNIHASGRPAGEIRGQILPRTVDHFSFVLTGGQVVPPTGSTATGNCAADLSDDAGSLSIQCRNSIPNPTAIHLHDAPPGENGPVVFDFPLGSSFTGTAPLTPRLVADFAAGFLYLDIHSAIEPDGEIRGQLTASSAAATAIPALDGWMMMLLAAALVSLALWRTTPSS
jgi:hypothetical protein